MFLNSFAISDHRRLVDIFADYFEVVQAETPMLLKIAYRLRYQVYCLETGFEDPTKCPNQLEKDAFDKHSAHALLRHKHTGIFAGTVRLVLPREGLKNCFPIHNLVRDPFFFDEKRFPPMSIAEISRFAISKEFRKRLGEYHSPSAASEHQMLVLKREEQRIIPHIILGLFIGMIKMSAEKGIKHWFCVMEPALIRLLSRYGLYFTPCAPKVNYHGIRQPCYAHIEEFLERAHKERPDVWELITNDGQLWR